MKRRPTFPAQLEPTLAKNRPNAHGAVLVPAAMPAAATVVPPVQACAIAPAQSFVAATGHALSSGVALAGPRARMVQLLQKQGVTDPAVLQAMATVERHRFVDSALVGQAYEDTSLPIGLGQTISKPGVVSRMLELLRHGASGRLGRVLEVGTGCGYQAAVLSLLATEVYSIERLRGLHGKARENLRHLRLPNVHLLFGDGTEGYAKGAPYAAIIAAAGGEAVPQTWVDQLAVGGRLVAPVAAPGAGGVQALLVLDKTAQGLRQTLLEPVHFVPLKSGVA